MSRSESVRSDTEPVPRYWFADDPSLQQFLNRTNSHMACRFGGRGDGVVTPPRAAGIQTNRRTAQACCRRCVRAVTKLEANGYPPATFVLHPNDWETIELAVASVKSAVEFQVSLPFDARSPERCWGLPITLTNAQTAAFAHTLASGAVGLNTDTQGVQIAWSETSNADDWSRST